jgi:hypothetical protein
MEFRIEQALRLWRIINIFPMRIPIAAWNGQEIDNHAWTYDALLRFDYTLR